LVVEHLKEYWLLVLLAVLVISCSLVYGVTASAQGLEPVPPAAPGDVMGLPAHLVPFATAFVYALGTLGTVVTASLTSRTKERLSRIGDLEDQLEASKEKEREEFRGRLKAETSHEAALAKLAMMSGEHHRV